MEVLAALLSNECIGEVPMQVKHASIGAISVIALIWLSPVSQASAPLSLATGGLKADTAESSGVEHVAYRVCWLKDGIYPKCTWYQDPPYYYHRYGYYDYGPYRRCWLKHGVYPKCR
jgi:hypothetical protein